MKKGWSVIICRYSGIDTSGVVSVAQMNWKGMTGKKVSKANHKNTTSALTIQNQIQNIKIKINSLGT